MIKWTPDIQTLGGQQKIIAINFGFQKVWDGFELYLSGHSWYDDHDSQLIDKEWTPRENYISLGEGSLQFDRLKILEMYEEIVEDQIKREKKLYNKLERIFIGPNDGDPKRLK